jgi:hypothetical protein
MPVTRLDFNTGKKRGNLLASEWRMLIMIPIFSFNLTEKQGDCGAERSFLATSALPIRLAHRWRGPFAGLSHVGFLEPCVHT